MQQHCLTASVGNPALPKASRCGRIVRCTAPRTTTLLCAGLRSWIAFFALPCLATGSAIAQVPIAKEDEVHLESYSDYGTIGLLQMPSARMAPEGELAIYASQVRPNRRIGITLQPIPGFEASIRYTTVTNRYLDEQTYGSNKYLDKSADLKLRLSEESNSFPEMAIGLRDIGGTGLFSSEYLVANKRYYDADFTLGIGWGGLGARGTIPNPLGALSSSFKQRKNDFRQGGTISVGNFFRGEHAGIFAGVSYRLTENNQWLFKAEYDSNDYQHEPQSNNHTVKSPINLGLLYRPSRTIDLGLGVERGNMFVVQLVLHGNLHRTAPLQKFDPAPEPLLERQQIPHLPPQEALEKAQQALTARGFKVHGLVVRDQQAVLAYSQTQYYHEAQGLGRAARILANHLPASVESITLAQQTDGINTEQVTLSRSTLEQAIQANASPEELYRTAQIQQPEAREKLPSNFSHYPYGEWKWSPGYRQSIGGPDNAYLYQFYLSLGNEITFAPGLSLSTGFNFNLYNNFDELKYESNSTLPHVRSDIKHYLKEGKNSISRMELDYLTALGSSFYGRLSAGILEEMYGGAGGEVLYWPYGQNWAVGIDAYRVRQRGFDQRFKFRDYQVSTGHIDLYYKLPWYNAQLQLSAGRYLAGDVGYTANLSRQFDTGITVGVFATKTNVSAEQFGEGSFDKGFYLSIPLDFLSFYSSKTVLGLGWRPLTRDGGQRLAVGKQLYQVLENGQPENLARGWSQLLK